MIWSSLLKPKLTSITPAPTIAIAPNHCLSIIVSDGSSNEALMIATITSDIIRSPTRPGNKYWDTLNIIIKLGRKTIIDQKSDDGRMVSINDMLGVISE